MKTRKRGPKPPDEELADMLEDEQIAECIGDLRDHELADFISERPEAMLRAFEVMPSIDRDLLWPQLVQAARQLAVRNA